MMQSLSGSPHSWDGCPAYLLGQAQRLREQILEAVVGVLEQPSITSVPLQRSVALRRCRPVLDKPVGPVHHGWLAAVTCVCRIPRATRHEGMPIARNDVVNEIVMPIIARLLSIGGLVQASSAQEAKPTESQSDCSIERSLHEVFLRLDHRESNGRMLLNGVVENILNGDGLLFTGVFEGSENGQVAGSEILDCRSLRARGEHTHVAVHDHSCLCVLEVVEQIIRPSHGAESSCRRSRYHEVGQSLVEISFGPINSILGVGVTVLWPTTQCAVRDERASIAVGRGNEGPISEAIVGAIFSDSWSRF